MRERLSRDPDPMTLRRCTVEHPFGTIKGWMGYTHSNATSRPRTCNRFSKSSVYSGNQ